MKLSKIWKDQKDHFDICFRNKMSEIPVKNHGKKPNKFVESRNKFVWNLHGIKWKPFFASWKRSELDCTNRAEFLFRVLLGIGRLFRAGTPHSSVPLRITSRSSEGERQRQNFDDNVIIITLKSLSWHREKHEKF